ncbi:MAG: phenylalanine--tRNA ligase subunit beta [Pseudomonadota bacterium]
MKFTLAWLKEHLETEAKLPEILDALTDLGLEVEGVEDPADQLGAFTICRVIEAVQHPNADRLRLCRVEAWPNGPDQPSEEVQVVCGAPNARTGLVGVFAAPGTHIPGTGVDLKPGNIRGVDSNGMLCSERELMLSDDHDGIIDLPQDAPLGARYIDYAGGNDPVIDIAITPNRPDALGVAGIARDLAARGLGTLITKPGAAVQGNFASLINVTIDADVQARGCPVFCGRLIRGVRNGPSPDWLQKRLKAIGLRPISTLVDITNLYTFDRNRPLHVFDADKVAGDLRVHFAKGGETLKALDEKDYTFEPGMMVISDDQGPESIAGIMGGLATGCTDETVNVFVESAYWDPVMIAASGRKLKINSDARYRFERGVDPAFTPEGLDLATAMIVELCGGEVSEMVVAGSVPDTTRSYDLDPDRVVSLVGMEIARDEQVRILRDLGFDVQDGETLRATPPTWRPDVQGEADLVEEIARVTSLTKLQAAPMRRPAEGVAKPTLTRMQGREAAARRQLAALGLNECVTYSFVSEAEGSAFGGGGETMALDNPISSEMSHMRPSLLPGLLAAAARNQARGLGDLGLFEVGPVFHGAEPGEQSLNVAALRTGHTAPRDWTGTRRAVDLYDAKADAEAILAGAGVDPAKLMVMRDVPDWFHPGRSAMLKLGPKNALAAFGELHPRVLAMMDVKGPAVAVTVFLENIPFPKTRARTRPALARHDLQAVDRDFAFVVDQATEAETILRAARGADKKLIAGARVFDIFTGEKAAAQFGEGQKSIAITLHLQPTEATLTDEEIEALSTKVVAAVEKATGGHLRR